MYYYTFHLIVHMILYYNILFVQKSFLPDFVRQFIFNRIVVTRCGCSTNRSMLMSFSECVECSVVLTEVQTKEKRPMHDVDNKMFKIFTCRQQSSVAVASPTRSFCIGKCAAAMGCATSIQASGTVAIDRRYLGRSMNACTTTHISPWRNGSRFDAKINIDTFWWSGQVEAVFWVWKKSKTATGRLDGFGGFQLQLKTGSPHTMTIEQHARVR